MTSEPIVTTKYGDVRGRVSGSGVLTFQGIPYAAAPVGPNRFQPPQPPESWSAPRDATEYGPTAPQAEVPEDGPFADLSPRSVVSGDDYLNLNVWTADLGGRSPVMVFVHGGSFTSGSGSISGYDGTRFARDGVVLVTINYRLGADGFLWFGDGIPNLGLLDQIAALTWVRDNISGFGGDPGNVTVFGESAGAMSVCSLLTMPTAEGLFHRAIAESGAGHSTISPATARLVGNRLAALLGVEPTREAIAEVAVPRLIAAQTQLAQEITAKPKTRLWGDVARNLMPFEPIVDGELLPGPPIERIAAGVGAQVEVLIGTNSEEARLFLIPTGAVDKITGLVVQAAAVRYGLPPLRGAARYRANRPGATPGDLLSAIATDWYYWIPALRLAEAHPGTHVYEFAWRSPAFGDKLGACHALELPFVFDNLDDRAFSPFIGENPPQQVADAMHKAWIDFATSGDPGWPAYTAEHRVAMRFDTASAITVDDRADERALWSRRR
ncbi:carboxylesterase/lipase family protein [Amycolatopsis jiangsuensis]|uniref:Carboxylic ester hydrolase n=1 Tax=Amycolatopsis jiangsuensis TaxID=1181879 RepID=A0A840IWI9_9PSEU|nr:carboxylesterase family protein [Amycolatopsis jiangsuensis]MBB4685572.1 para-nitrobenzyl esterase [Amycolatopsis jiangsuensis]